MVTQFLVINFAQFILFGWGCLLGKHHYVYVLCFLWMFKLNEDEFLFYINVTFWITTCLANLFVLLGIFFLILTKLCSHCILHSTRSSIVSRFSLANNISPYKRPFFSCFSILPRSNNQKQLYIYCKAGKTSQSIKLWAISF